jgi:hypothetical protein
MEPPMTWLLLALLSSLILGILAGKMIHYGSKD